jgi:DNA polymerase-1
MNYIITKNKSYFSDIGEYNFCNLEDMILPRKIAFDSETTHLKPFKGEMFCCQIGTGTNNYLIDLESINIKDVENYIVNKILVIHNALFDLTWLYKYNIFPWKIRDTLLASQILYNGIRQNRHNFGAVFKRELNLDYDKSEQANISNSKLSTKEAINYCFQDVDRLLELEQTLNKKIVKEGYVGTYNLHCRWIRACAYMQTCGVPINELAWKEKCNNDKIILKEKELIIKEYIFDNCPQFRKTQLSLFDFGKEINVLISSPLQMIKVFNAFGINTYDKKEEKDSIGEEIISKSNHEFVKKWLEYQSINHDVTTFGENFFPSIYKGRLYTNYKPILDTARISAGGKNKDKSKEINTLNIPKGEKSRKPFEAKQGFKYLVADYSAQETVTGAEITGDLASINSVANDLDLHCAFARVLYPELQELTDEEIKINYSEKRNKAKSPRFTFQFGGSAYTLAMKEGISMEEATIIENGYKELHSGIYEYGEKKLEEVIKKGYIESTLGFKLHLSNFEWFKHKHEWINSLNKSFWSDYRVGKLEYKKYKQAEEKKEKYIVKSQNTFDLYRKNVSDISKYFQQKGEYFRLCLNNPTQAMAAHQTKAATNAIFEYIWKKKHFWKARISLVPHDEIGMEVKDELAEEYKLVISNAMINEGNKFLKNPKLKMKAETNIANNWYEAK